MRTKIYFLLNEFFRVRYVGKTCGTLKDRLWGHLYEAKRRHKCKKCNGIRKMFRGGLIPTITLQTEVEGNGNNAERAYIRHFRNKGVDLWNLTEGGDGAGVGTENHFFGKHHTKEMIAWFREIRKGKYNGKDNPNFGNHVLKGKKRPEHSKWMTEHNSFAGKRHKEKSIQQIKDSIRKGFENGRVGYWKGKKMPPHKEGCRCASCMSKRGEGYEWDHTKLPPPTEQTRLKMGEAHKRHKEDCKCIACMAKRGEFYKRKMK